jgi:hypothetical protein
MTCRGPRLRPPHCCAKPTRRPAQTAPKLPGLRLLGLPYCLRRLQQLAAAPDRRLPALPAHRCSPAGRQLPSLLPAPRPTRPRRAETGLDPAVARRRPGTPTRDSVRDARLPRTTPEGTATRGRRAATGPAALRAPGRPEPRRPVRRPPGLELHHHRPTRPAALAHRQRPSSARRVRPPRPPSLLGRTGPPTLRPQPAHPARVGRRGRPHRRGRHPVAAHRPARHQRPPDPAVPHTARPGHPRAAARRPRASRRRAHPDPPRQRCRRTAPLGTGPARRRPTRPPCDAVRDDPQVSRLPPPGPDRVGRPGHQPAGDHQRRCSPSPHVPAGLAGPGPAQRATQPVPGTQTGTTDLPRPHAVSRCPPSHVFPRRSPPTGYAA